LVEDFLRFFLVSEVATVIKVFLRECWPDRLLLDEASAEACSEHRHHGHKS
jgi:hypothetical protein